MSDVDLAHPHRRSRPGGPDEMIRMGAALLLAVGIMFAAAACTQDPGTSREQEALSEVPFAHELQDALDHALRAGQGAHDLGISAAVSVPGMRPWIGVSGNSHPGVPITPDMLFDAGSIAKTFEAALALRLSEQGLLSLDDPISRWLPPFPNVDGRITLRQLLNHTSGIFNIFEHPDFPWVGSHIDYARRWKLEEVITSFVLEPYGLPGEVQHYSSTNYLVLTAVIEKATGVSVPTLIERTFLSPLRLQHTFVSMGDLPPARFPVAHPWVDVDEDGKLNDLAGTPYIWIATLTHPSIHTTPGDLTRWMQALLHNRSVLSEDSMNEMLTFPVTAVPDPEGGKYGLGVVDYSEVLGMKVIGHGGSSLGYSAVAMYMPEFGTSVAWAVNTGEGPHQLAQGIMGKAWSSLSEVLRTHLNQ